VVDACCNAFSISQSISVPPSVNRITLRLVAIRFLNENMPPERRTLTKDVVAGIDRHVIGIFHREDTNRDIFPCAGNVTDRRVGLCGQVSIPAQAKIQQDKS